LQDGDYIDVATHGWKAFGFGVLNFIQGIFGVGMSPAAL